MRVEPAELEPGLSSRRGACLARLAVAALLALAVAGCATSSCTGDPRTDNVWCADKGLTEGLYDADLEAKKKTLADTQKKAASEAGKGQQLRARLTALRARRQRIERELAAMLTRLDRSARQKSGQDARIASLRAEIAKALEEQRAARVRLDREVRRLESGKADMPKTPVVSEKVVVDEETSVLSDEQGMRLFARQVEEVTRS